MQTTSTSHLIGSVGPTIDPRNALQKLSRRDLRRFCRTHGVPFEMEQPATDLVEMLLRRGFSGTEGIKEDAPAVSVEMENKSVPIEKPDYSLLPFPELRKLAKQRGLKQTPKMNKEALVRLLTDG